MLPATGRGQLGPGKGLKIIGWGQAAWGSCMGHPGTPYKGQGDSVIGPLLPKPLPSLGSALHFLHAAHLGSVGSEGDLGKLASRAHHTPQGQMGAVCSLPSQHIVCLPEQPNVLSFGPWPPDWVTHSSEGTSGILPHCSLPASPVSLSPDTVRSGEALPGDPPRALQGGAPSQWSSGLWVQTLSCDSCLFEDLTFREN